MATISKLDLAWEAVNALGGTGSETNQIAEGMSFAIDMALQEIEKLGGKDPAPARARGAAEIVDDGGSAFPFAEHGPTPASNGMSLRDWFA